MSTDNVTPIHDGPQSPAPLMKKGGSSTSGLMSSGLREDLVAAIEIHQSRVWKLRSLIQCVAEQVEGEGPCDIDVLGSMLGLADYANVIHDDMDAEQVIGRLEKEKEAADGVNDSED